METSQVGAGSGRRPQPRSFANSRRPKRRVVIAALLAALSATAAQCAPTVLRQLESHPKAADFDIATLRAPAPAGSVFADTLPVHCPRSPRGPVAASFTITLRRPAADARSPSALRLGFWDRGIEHFSMRVGSGREPAGAIDTMRFDLAALPPVGGPVLRNTGHGLRLLRDRDFSFSVSDRAAVLQALLTYRCAEDAFSFATVEPNSVIGDYRSGDAWRSAPSIGGWPPVPQRRDARPGRLSGGLEFE